MTDRPIIMSAPMVRAILAGTKTETRRLLGPGNLRVFDGGSAPWRPSREQVSRATTDVDGMRRVYADVWAWSAAASSDRATPDSRTHWFAHASPAPADKLWVREAWAPISPDEHERPIQECRIEYRADTTAEAPGHWDEVDRSERPRYARWRSPIHMPRWASRITLAVTEVRVERLQEISRESAIAEGLTLASSHIEEFWRWPAPYDESLWLSPVAAYRFLWEQTRGPGSWNANPWVMAVRFVPTLANIDAGGAE